MLCPYCYEEPLTNADVPYMMRWLCLFGRPCRICEGHECSLVFKNGKQGESKKCATRLELKLAPNNDEVMAYYEPPTKRHCGSAAEPSKGATALALFPTPNNDEVMAYYEPPTKRHCGSAAAV